jgi:chaperone required for assembly of F1-ATPase
MFGEPTLSNNEILLKSFEHGYLSQDRFEYLCEVKEIKKAGYKLKLDGKSIRQIKKLLAEKFKKSPESIQRYLYNKVKF